MIDTRFLVILLIPFLIMIMKILPIHTKKVFIFTISLFLSSFIVLAFFTNIVLKNIR